MERDLKCYQNLQCERLTPLGSHFADTNVIGRHKNVLQLFGASDEHIPSPFILFQSSMY